ncbi:hypothetical protein SADUNF_Sadunf09G0007300 [Salix dunnii]|uniref:cytokinin riboside 5'-monophosphate phosphoribohydrolase n=1 Tax=Salix dunnii TaxID=1413687 RepID=A0A835MSQ5_9ROSI|nr:hypothetical protein SADUNF_Sadunf09G0007300 [Salix dunnii]
MHVKPQKQTFLTFDKEKNEAIGDEANNFGGGSGEHGLVQRRHKKLWTAKIWKFKRANGRLCYRYICARTHYQTLLGLCGTGAGAGAGVCGSLLGRGYFFKNSCCSLFSEKERGEREMEMEMKQSRFKRICVFCGSSPGKKSSYKDAALELGKEMVSRNIDLVYGGGSIGLMGLISQAVFDGGRHVIGVIPKTLMPREITGETVGEVKAVADMHKRKAEMARHSDAFIALPGGYGTLEELLEVITWSQLGIHDKPVKHPFIVGLLNVDGFYNSLLSFIDKAVEEGFINPSARHIIVSAPTPRELVKKMEEYFPRHEIVASKLSWEIEQLGYPSQCDISR